ncbi:MAG: hypothetical protein M1448_02605 [Candidatus Marsarchaeota archaeon]|jgi:NADH-ubiquinone/plastoquinone oxidoreductase chain 6.|nr:hypothetical protein [Candidatus Marsarchaeota archaeon]
MALDIVVFALWALASVAFASLIFYFKDIMHVAIALAFLFLSLSAVYLILGQPLLAVVQVFIMVGGVSTYLMVGSASAVVSRFKHSNVLAGAILSLVLFGMLFYPVVSSGAFGGSFPLTPLTASATEAAMESGIAPFYLLATLLFGISIGSIVLFKKAMR